MRRLLTACLLASAVPVLGALPAQATLIPGGWNSPAAGATVSGVVHLSINTTGNPVTFVVPGANLPASVVSGVATADWDTVGTPNGTYTITANECDLLGCSPLTRDVTVANAVSTPPAGTGGGGTTPPTTTPPGGLPAKPQVTILDAPTVFHPVTDGLADRLKVTVRVDRPVTLYLGVYQGRHGTPVYGSASHIKGAGTGAVSSVAHLAPGSWHWIVKAVAGKASSKTVPRTAVADAKKLTTVTTTLDKMPAKLSFNDYSGACSTAKASGGDVVLASLSRCSRTTDTADVALAGFHPGVVPAVSYTSLKVTITTSGGSAVVFVYRGGTDQVAAKHVLSEGTTTFSVSPSLLVAAKHQLQFDVGTAGGQTVHLTDLSVAVTARVLR